MVLDRPIPAFYCCYLLRSTVSRGSVYVGSTPNPVRRLRQHNGDAKGGAARTSRPNLRPWEMSCIVTGFPSHIAALQFEWAWQNPHITTHIPPSSRLTHSTSRKKSNHPKRPRHTIASLLSNLHLLLRVPTFSRWPLALHFFSPDVHKAWQRWIKTTTPDPIRPSLPIIQSFQVPPSNPESSKSNSDNETSPRSKRRKLNHGIQGMEISYSPQKPHVEKSKNIIDFEREGTCSICNEDLEPDGGVYAICPSSGCESVTHLTCLSQHFQDDEATLVPISGTCPSCKSNHRWIDIVKETTLRMRGQKQITELLKVKRIRKSNATAPQAVIESSASEAEISEEEYIADIKEAQLRELSDVDEQEAKSPGHDISDSDSDAASIRSSASKVRKRTRKPNLRN